MWVRTWYWLQNTRKIWYHRSVLELLNLSKWKRVPYSTSSCYEPTRFKATGEAPSHYEVTEEAYLHATLELHGQIHSALCPVSQSLTHSLALSCTVLALTPRPTKIAQALRASVFGLVMHAARDAHPTNFGTPEQVRLQHHNAAIAR
jgi:hypothetical protein